MKLIFVLECVVIMLGITMFFYPVTPLALETHESFWDCFLLMPLGLLVSSFGISRWLRPNERIV